MSTPDTPDNQYGVANPQKLLAVTAAGVQIATVTLPANAETLAVLVNTAGGYTGAYCAGVTTGVIYPTATLETTAIGATWNIAYFDVSSALDAEVNIGLFSSPGAEWFVYSDQAVRMTVDPVLENTIALINAATPESGIQIAGSDGADLRSVRVMQNGLLYGVPSAPSEQSGDRPLTELLWANNGGTAATGALIGAPGAGKRIRLFYLAMWANNAAAAGYISAQPLAGGSASFCVQEQPAGVTPPPCVLPLTGFACLANTAVVANVSAGNLGFQAGYTIENV